MKKLKIAIICMLSFAMILMTGCWNYREVDSVSIVAGMAVDEGEHGQKYHTTFEVLDLTGGKEKPVSPKVIETDGATIFDAVRNAVKESEKKLFFSHCKIFVISSKLAKEGISPIIDWINRDSELRLESNLIVSKEKTAKEILEAKGLTDPITSYEISKMLDNDDKVLSKSQTVKLYEVNNLLNCRGISLTLPAVKNIYAKTVESSLQSSGSQSQAGLTPTLDGTAVFKGDKLIGMLSSEDTKYYLFVRNKIKGGLIVLDYTDHGKGITLEILSSKTSVVPAISNGHVLMKVKVQTKVGLAEDETSRDYSTKEGMKTVEKLAAQTIERHIKAVVAKVQRQYDSDIFGFGESIYKYDNSLWQELKEQWGKRFMSIQCDASAQVEILDTAIVKSKAKAGS